MTSSSKLFSIEEGPLLYNVLPYLNVVDLSNAASCCHELRSLTTREFENRDKVIPTERKSQATTPQERVIRYYRGQSKVVENEHFYRECTRMSPPLCFLDNDDGIKLISGVDKSVEIFVRLYNRQEKKVAWEGFLDSHPKNMERFLQSKGHDFGLDSSCWAASGSSESAPQNPNHDMQLIEMFSQYIVSVAAVTNSKAAPIASITCVWHGFRSSFTNQNKFNAHFKCNLDPGFSAEVVLPLPGVGKRSLEDDISVRLCA